MMLWGANDCTSYNYVLRCQARVDTFQQRLPTENTCWGINLRVEQSGGVREVLGTQSKAWRAYQLKLIEA